MRWSVNIVLLTLLSGCGGLERDSYPISHNASVLTGAITHVQPYKGESSESNLSRFGWGTLAGGLIAGGMAGLSDSDMGSFDAFSYVVKTQGNRSEVFDSYSLLPIGTCVEVFPSVKEGMYSIERRDDSVCDFF